MLIDWLCLTKGGQMKKVFYSGLDPSHYHTHKEVVHVPLVEIDARPFDSLEIQEVFSDIYSFSHIIFTSKSSAQIFLRYFRRASYEMKDLDRLHIIAIGPVTAHYLQLAGLEPSYIAADETQEGVIRVLSSLDMTEANVLIPKSSSARPVLAHYLVEHNIHYRICILYDMYKKRPDILPDLNDFDEVVFTTPRCVESFFDIYHDFPSGIDFHAMGSYTRETLREKLAKDLVTA